MASIPLSHPYWPGPEIPPPNTHTPAPPPHPHTYLPECIVEDLLRLRGHAVLERIDVDLGVQLVGRGRGHCGLGAEGGVEGGRGVRVQGSLDWDKGFNKPQGQPGRSG